jgi:serine/threonine protein kinase
LTRAHPAPPRADPSRLHDALAQTALGLCALHAASKIHCDVKPSNVLVTPSGRVVLLAFGLVTEVARTAGSGSMQIAGTVAYMAPEQAASKLVAPSADWYSVGAMLYEALTGQAPFVGAPFDVLTRKQRSEPVPPSAVADAVPADLDALCVDLLRVDPAKRPSGDEVLTRLGIRLGGAVHGASSMQTMPSLPPLVGRGREQQALAAAFDDMLVGRTVRVLVEGESGIGKSALVRRFVDSLEAERRDVIVLEGRCYERESCRSKPSTVWSIR